MVVPVREILWQLCTAARRNINSEEPRLSFETDTNAHPLLASLHLRVEASFS